MRRFDAHDGKGNSSRKPRGGQPGHKGHKQELLEPTETKHILPRDCQCGGTEFEDQGVFYTHQEIELPDIETLGSIQKNRRPRPWILKYLWTG